MQPRYRLLLFFMLAMPALHPVLAQDLPAAATRAEALRAAVAAHSPMPPEGFEWQVHKNAVFLKPMTWKELTKASLSSGMLVTAYATSPEDFSDTKQFELGMTLQIISAPLKSRRIEARKMALLYLKPFIEGRKREDILLVEQKVAGDFERTSYRYRDTAPGQTPLVVHKLILANDAMDSVHVFTFESPEEQWNESWMKFGRPILNQISILKGVPSN